MAVAARAWVGTIAGDLGNGAVGRKVLTINLGSDGGPGAECGIDEYAWEPKSCSRARLRQRKMSVRGVQPRFDKRLLEIRVARNGNASVVLKELAGLEMKIGVSACISFARRDDAG